LMEKAGDKLGSDKMQQKGADMQGGSSGGYGGSGGDSYGSGGGRDNY